MNKFHSFTHGYDKLWSILRLLHFIYLGLLLVFIGFYFFEYRPYKLHTICAEKSAKQVLKLNPQDAASLYHNLYQSCLSQR